MGAAKPAPVPGRRMKNLGKTLLKEKPASIS
jgi:hypothetical protein